MTGSQDMTNLEDTPRRPRVALMGEFSAGKSTLTNLLLGADPLPVKITATRLPPVWISHGTGPAQREDELGNLHPLGADGLAGVQMGNTSLIRLEMQSDILDLCDLIDMPGISDPNMDAAVWRDVIGQADLVVWCTHATQAWRQSEMAAFDSLPQHLRETALLLITRFDKLQTDRDRRRVLTRVRAETGDRFRAIFPVALLDALSSGDDLERWRQSGAEPFVKALIDLIADPTARNRQDEGHAKQDIAPSDQPAPDNAVVRPLRVTTAPGGIRRARPGQADEQSVAGHG